MPLLSDPTTWPRASRRVVLGAAAGALSLFLAGLYAGNEVPWGTKTPQTHVGTAFLHNEENYLTSFDSDDGDKLIGFNARDVPWEAGGTTHLGGRPACLRVDRGVPVELSVIEYETPGGGAYTAVVWVRCR